MGDIQWHIFGYIVSQVETPLVNTIAHIVDAFLNFVASPLKVALVLYIALTGILILRGQADEAGSALLTRFLKMGLVVWVLTGSGVYQQYVYDFFFTTLPQGLEGALTSGGSGTVDANSFDAVWAKAFLSGLSVWNSLSWHDIGQAIVVIVFWAAAALSTVVTFFIWMVSRLFLALFIVVGPLVIGLALFPATRSVFERWIGALISCVVLQVMTIILLYLLLDVEKQLVDQIAPLTAGESMKGIQILFSGVIFFLIAAFAAFNLPSLASSLSGGLHFHTGAIARGLQKMSGSTGHKQVNADGSTSRAGRSGALGLAHATGSAAWAGTKAGGRAVMRRIRPSPGGNLSNSD